MPRTSRTREHKPVDDKRTRTEFDRLLRLDWSPVLEDSGTADWQRFWFLDGESATVRNTKAGMEFFAGPAFGNDADHAVLWTRDSFAGDIRIDYEFTRLDREHRCVNILYLQATGSGEGPYATDIGEWSHLRRIPAMREYFEHMHTYHLSYAAFTNDDSNDPGYIRARRYTAGPLEGTEIAPDYDPAGLFEYAVPHRMTVVKSGDHIYFRIVNDARDLLCRWHNSAFPPIKEGRIGLRHMFTRGARYRDIRIATR